MANTTNFGWETPDDTDLVKDGAAAMRTLGNSIDTSLVDLKGGTTGQILSKASNTDLDYTWVSPNPGDITGVTAGTGISGGGTSGDVTITNSMATTIDAKGDLIVGTGNDAFSRLAVGSNGFTLVADSSTSTGLAYSGTTNGNPVINGGMDIWQRGTSFAAGTGTIYTADRWQANKNGVAGLTISRQTTSDTTNLPFIQYSARVQRDSGITSTAAQNLFTSLESVNSIPFAGRTVTLSFYARAGANYSSTSSILNANLYTGTGTDQNYWNGLTGQANPVGGTATLTTTWQRFSFSGTLASTTTQIAIAFNNTPTGTASTNDWFEVTGIQIDLGSTALPFRRSGGTIQGELQAAQRYYWRHTPGVQYAYLGIGTATSTTNLRALINIPPMRVAPTSFDYSTLAVGNAAGVLNSVSSATVEYSAPNTQAVNFVTTGLTAGNTFLALANSTTGYIGFSAEL